MILMQLQILLLRDELAEHQSSAEVPVLHMDDIKSKKAQILVVSLVRTGMAKKRQGQGRFETRASDIYVQGYITTSAKSMTILVGDRDLLLEVWKCSFNSEHSTINLTFKDLEPQPEDLKLAIVPFVPRTHFFLDTRNDQVYAYQDLICPIIAGCKFLWILVNNMPYWATPAYTERMAQLECPSSHAAVFEWVDLTDDELPHWVTPAFKWVH
jgi:hypothetical protein